MRRITAALSFPVLLFCVSATAEKPIQGGYSTQPLAEAVFEPAKVAVEAAIFNNWLNSNHASLTAESMKGPREHLYYLIDSKIKEIYQRDKVVWPREHDLILEIFFSWADRLGVFGGAIIYNSLRPEQAPELPTTMDVPEGFNLHLDGDLLSVKSEYGGWSVSIPYYFMIWGISDWRAIDGPRTQLLALSTGAAPHQGVEEHSQATLTLLFGPHEDAKAFESYWSKQHGFTGSEVRKPLPVEPLSSIQRFDPSTNLHVEYTSWKTPKGPVFVAYSGISGPYQWNRPHFIDFLQSLREANP